jgi:hypothetical protein
MAEPRRYEMKLHVTVDARDPALLLDAAYARWCAKLTALEEFTDWHKEQWQRWVDDGTSDPTDDPAWGADRRGVDVALHEFLRPDHTLDPNIPGANWGFAGSSCAEDTLPPMGPRDAW